MADAKNSVRDTLAEWLRRCPAKAMGSPRVSSNLTGVALLSPIQIQITFSSSNHPISSHSSLLLCLFESAFPYEPCQVWLANAKT
jgi:hypothetical protein